MCFSPFYPLPGNLVCQSFLNVEASKIINYIFMKADIKADHINTQNFSFTIITFLVLLHSIHHRFLLLLSFLHHLYLNLAQN